MFAFERNFIFQRSTIAFDWNEWTSRGVACGRLCRYGDLEPLCVLESAKVHVLAQRGKRMCAAVFVVVVMG